MIIRTARFRPTRKYELILWALALWTVCFGLFDVSAVYGLAVIMLPSTFNLYTRK
jgi:hypothetical protein